MAKIIIQNPLTRVQKADNEAARKTLKPGSYYLFEPAVEATGFPVGGKGVCKPQVLKFHRGFYLGFRDGQHVFQGKPTDDPRRISNKLRECFFRIDFVGGVSVSIDSNQSH